MLLSDKQIINILYGLADNVGELAEVERVERHIQALQVENERLTQLEAWQKSGSKQGWFRCKYCRRTGKFLADRQPSPLYPPTHADDCPTRQIGE